MPNYTIRSPRLQDNMTKTEQASIVAAVLAFLEDQTVDPHLRRVAMAFIDNLDDRGYRIVEGSNPSGDSDDGRV